jgi:hypothetical protein
VSEDVRTTHPRIRDRRGRDRRGPTVVPGPLGVPPTPTRRQRFDGIVLRVVSELQTRWPRELADVEFGVEDVPWLDDEWWPTGVPLATLVPRTSRRPTRIVVYRWPIQARARRDRLGPAEREIVHAALVQQVAELLE